MNVALQRAWTVEGFLLWAEAQNERYEFDGVRPVLMTGGTADHSQITLNIHFALRNRLRGTPCRSFGPDLGLRSGDAVHFPDAVISCTNFPGTERLVAEPRVAFEVLSPSTARNDRVTKVSEYAAVPTLLRYIMVEVRFPRLTVLHRTIGSADWATVELSLSDVLLIPEASTELPVAELYEGIEFPPEPSAPE